MMIIALAYGETEAITEDDTNDYEAVSGIVSGTQECVHTSTVLQPV